MVRNFSARYFVSFNFGEGVGVRGGRSADFGTNSQIRIVNVLGPRILSHWLSWQMALPSVPLEMFLMVNRIHHRLVIPEI